MEPREERINGARSVAQVLADVKIENAARNRYNKAKTALFKRAVQNKQDLTKEIQHPLDEVKKLNHRIIALVNTLCSDYSNDPEALKVAKDILINEIAYHSGVQRGRQEALDRFQHGKTDEYDVSLGRKSNIGDAYWIVPTETEAIRKRQSFIDKLVQKKQEIENALAHPAPKEKRDEVTVPRLELKPEEIPEEIPALPVAPSDDVIEAEIVSETIDD